VADEYRIWRQAGKDGKREDKSPKKLPAAHADNEQIVHRAKDLCPQRSMTDQTQAKRVDEKSSHRGTVLEGIARRDRREATTVWPAGSRNKEIHGPPAAKKGAKKKKKKKKQGEGSRGV